MIMLKVIIFKDMFKIVLIIYNEDLEIESFNWFCIIEGS